MKIDNYRNDVVEVYSFRLAGGEELSLNPQVGPDQAEFFEENGWAYVYGVTVLLEGEMTISSELFPDTTVIHPDHDLWINGVDKMSGTPHIFKALTDVNLACLTYRDHHLPSASAKIMLSASQEHVFDTPGWAYVGTGSVDIDGLHFPAHSMLKIETVGKAAITPQGAVLSFIGL